MNENVLHGISGATSSLVAMALLHPLEALRTRMQSTHSKVDLISFLTELHRKDGLLSLYSGFLSSLIGTTTSYGIYFLCYRAAQRSLIKGKHLLTTLDDILVSLFSSVISVLISTPLWTINTRLMKGQSGGIISLFKKILREEGPQGLFKGMSGSLMLCLNPIIQYAGYEYAKKKLLRNKNASALVFFIFAGISKLLATFVTYPMLTLRTRAQLEVKKNLSIAEVFADLLKNEGIFALYKGLSSKAVQTVLNSAIMLSTHEKLTRLLVKLLAAKIKVGVRST
ncbi:unnamed protein product [Blepharisma stoltei]|uniref:Peroxisomal membrane protein PMP34 n=1 Tax=Blepharisma stoltei TaxID=1481888 RepID=A0AAU9IS56_9CILI|nr:unnamed protein product [Blepharisma stoltei]